MTYPTARTVQDFTRHLADVRSRVAAAAERAGRAASEVRLLPVSKTVPEDRVRLAVQAGCHELGENKVQEAARKHRELADLDVSWSIIGHLQRNKARDVAAFATEFQALDSRRIAPDTARVRECFRLLRTLRDRARQTDPDLIGPGELSMGMSGDYEAAVEEGATVVRVGQTVFGQRATPDSYYWPPTSSRV
ncbi:YggS family pyridoxal phosphate enzyme [Ornithinimicrobium avium]|uniref:YggS family pyridoxal phosphate-dependent enzyme n=1 Tax=Ornithinimicrobium avium TaxID=2283195 RepID=A0A345NME6_9MICO|nr:YggS family pyridoxal phosphate-dependent enzyme [Ornithinimicrobium avium]AXH96204.1 YggS family pyridoxal phosphate-dependent enzyme [Ornithinimicrobium avium]